MSVKVIKSGKGRIINYRTKCSCGCQFEFNSDDVLVGSYTGKYFIVCPECGYSVYNEWFKWKKVKNNK
jgi:hypothetical protein